MLRTHLRLSRCQYRLSHCQCMLRTVSACCLASCPQEPASGFFFSSTETRSNCLVAGNVFFISLMSYFTVYVSVQLYCMWPQIRIIEASNYEDTRVKDLRVQPPFLVSLISSGKISVEDAKFFKARTLEHRFVLLAALMIAIHWGTELTRYLDIGTYTKTTIYGDVTSGVFVVGRLTRCYLVWFSSRALRAACRPVTYLCTKMIGILTLGGLVFLMHYFLIQVAFYNQDTLAQAEVPYFKDNADGLFDLFVALTTANHPDGRSLHLLKMVLTYHWLCDSNARLLPRTLGVQLDPPFVYGNSNHATCEY